jgi:hypothetical protein
MFDRQATIIQAAFRGYLARKKYSIHSIQASLGLDYEAFLIGNDPVIAGLNKYAVKTGNMVLVATSCFRAIAMACRLANQSDKTIIPRVIIIDNSRQVIELWRIVIRIFKDSLDEMVFMQKFPALMAKHAYLFRVLDIINSPNNHTRYPDQDASHFFSHLFAVYGFEYIRKIVMNTIVKMQSWENAELFGKLKNIFNRTDVTQIVMYPSNIVASYTLEKNSEIINSILQNIKLLNPVVTIHTDLCGRHLKPEKVFLVEDNDVELVTRQLFPDGSRRSCRGPGYGV